MLYWFQVFNVVIQYFYSFYFNLNYYEILAIFPVLCNISLQLTYFINSSLYVLIPYPYSVPPPFLFLRVNH